MQFKEVIGQKILKNQLKEMVQHNRLSHALMFLEREGSGGLSLARALAQYLVCEKINVPFSKKVNPSSSLFGETEDQSQPLPGNGTPSDSCGVCPACIKASQMIHPDIHFSFPVVTRKQGEKPVSTDFIKEWRSFMLEQPYSNVYDWLQFIDAENKQGNITARECEEIVRKMSLKSFESPVKILIMWMPELLGKEGNRLLKIIEEPPPDTLFILVAINDTLILPTILSRSQLIKVPLLTELDVESTLELKNGIPLQKAQELAGLSGGNYREALQHLLHSENDWNELLRSWLNSILKTGPVAQVKWIDEISKIGREKQKQFLRYFLHLVEFSIRWKFIQSGEEKEEKNAVDFARRFNKLCDLSQLEAIAKELDNSIYHIERNAYAKILFHALTIRIYHIISNKSVILVN